MYRKSFKIAFIVLCALSIFINAQIDSGYKKGEIIFKITVPFTSIERENGLVSTDQPWFNILAGQYQIYELKPVFNSSLVKFKTYYWAFFDSVYTVNEVDNAFESEVAVVYAEPNYYIFLTGSSNDPHFAKQWGLRKIKADSAWQIESGNSSVIVGISDSGIDLGDTIPPVPHPDLAGNLWNENGNYGFNFTDAALLPDDRYGHGTHVAGIAGAVTNNNTGIAGTAGGGFVGDDDAM